MSTASAPHSHAASPHSQGQGQGHHHPNQDGELFSLDFLALAGLDSGMGEITSPNVKEGSTSSHSLANGQWDYMLGGGNDAGPSSQGGPSTTTRTSSTDTDATVGHKGGRKARGRYARDNGYGDMGRDVNSMDLDPVGSDYPQGQDEMRQDFDTLQAALLQQQLQAIHMQSPLGFDVTNPQFPLAQMFLSSPAVQMAQLQQQMSNDGQEGNQNLRHRRSIDQNWPVSQGAGGMPTPGASGEMVPQTRQDAMSPIHLEMLARQSEMNGDPNMLPLLSPALSQSTSTSNFNSPATTTAFSSHGHLTAANAGNKSPLEQLQEQQRQFQEQLAVLQQRQLEMQATAAAVVAASGSSPYGGSSGVSSGQSRPATTPGVTPSSGFFSPLTSPALEATNRAQHHRHHFSPAFNAQKARTPHPLSALSSPALNPVGSSGGAQQTLSPALGPQADVDLNDPEYIRALVGMFDGNPNAIGEPAQPSYQSPSMASTSTAGYSTILASPALNPTATTGTGPHRHSLSHKSRPSPMLKPTNHRSHQRVPSGQGGVYSVPTSPAVQKFHPNPPGMAGMGYLPPSAIDHRHLQSGASHSTASTPSPVDLSQMMPPPPVPNGTAKGRKGVAPMTPASLMNLASAPPIPEGVAAAQDQPSSSSQYNAPAVPPAPPKRASGGAAKAAGRKQTTAASANGGNKKGAAGKLAPSTNGAGGGGKRALAIRPQGGVGVRAAATKAAAALAAVPSEPETRKTSHKAAEQKRRDSLKAGFDELRLLLPPINVEALDAETGEPIPGSSAPRLLPKSSLVPDDNPNRGVSKVALLRFSNEYIDKLKARVERRDTYIERLRDEVTRLRSGDSEGGVNDELDQDDELGLGDVLDYDWREGEDEEFNPPETPEDEGDLEEGEGEGEENDEMDGGEEEEMDVEVEEQGAANGNARNNRRGVTKSFSASNPTKSPASKSAAGAGGRRPSLLKRRSSSGTTVIANANSRS